MASSIFAHFNGPNGLQIMVFTIYHPHISLLSHDTKEDREKETPTPRINYNEYLVIALMCDPGQAGSLLFGASLSHHMLFE